VHSYILLSLFKSCLELFDFVLSDIKELEHLMGHPEDIRKVFHATQSKY